MSHIGHCFSKIGYKNALPATKVILQSSSRAFCSDVAQNTRQISSRNSRYCQKKAMITCYRSFNSSSAALNKQTPSTSVFGDITKDEKDTTLASLAEQANSIAEKSSGDGTPEEELGDALSEQKKTITPETDSILQEYYDRNFPPLIASEALLSPMKKQVYDANVAKNGFFKSGETVKLPDGSSYKLSLTKEEIEALEPSIYLKSYRIKSSVKKATLVTRLLNQMPLKKAITQCHFSLKAIAKDIGEMLESALVKAPKVGLDPNTLYISRIWSGSDGSWVKIPEWKGRGRSGVIQFRYVHVRVVLKGPQTKKRLAWEKEQKKEKRRAWEQLPSEKIRGVSPGVFKW